MIIQYVTDAINNSFYNPTESFILHFLVTITVDTTKQSTWSDTLARDTFDTPGSVIRLQQVIDTNIPPKAPDRASSVTCQVKESPLCFSASSSLWDRGKAFFHNSNILGRWFFTTADPVSQRSNTKVRFLCKTPDFMLMFEYHWCWSMLLSGVTLT